MVDVSGYSTAELLRQEMFGHVDSFIVYICDRPLYLTCFGSYVCHCCPSMFQHLPPPRCPLFLAHGARQACPGRRTLAPIVSAREGSPCAK